MKNPDGIIEKKLIDTQSEAFLEILWTVLNVPGTERDKSILFEPMIIPYI